MTLSDKLNIRKLWFKCICFVSFAFVRSEIYEIMKVMFILCNVIDLAECRL